MSGNCAGHAGSDEEMMAGIVVETAWGAVGFLTVRPVAPQQERRPVAKTPGPLAAAEPLAVIGDIHGRVDLLDALLAALEKAVPGARRVFVGDLVDRGPASRDVLLKVKALTEAGAVALLGNHERMMRDFLADPVGAGRLWLMNGGTGTLESFGIDPFAHGPAGLAARLEAALEAAGLLSWLEARPLLWRSGNVVVVHALVDPGRPLEAQREEDLLWRRPSPADPPHRDGIWVVHGHTVMPAPVVAPGYVRIDLGAWRSGNLCAALIGAEGMAQP